MAKSLVAYFSASGVSAKLAHRIADIQQADVFEIKPRKVYTSEDLNWNDANSRSSIEMKDHAYRPEMIHNELDVSTYDVIYVGFPIWWYIAPTIINTFLESYDFTNKKIVLFATSGGSGFGKTVEHLQGSVSKHTTLQEGKVFTHTPTDDELKHWLNQI